MGKTCVGLLSLLIAAIPASTTADALQSAASMPAPAIEWLSPNAPEPPSLLPKNIPRETPVRVVIPSISLDDTIVPVGLTEGGAMDVPSGRTQNVGWLKGGTAPGQIGSAVLDAHVFAAFSRLGEVPVGSDIYVVTESGRTHHFVVEEAKTFPLNDLPPRLLFERNDARRLNLITCAGALTPDHKTYDHRLILFAKLVDEG